MPFFASHAMLAVIALSLVVGNTVSLQCYYGGQVGNSGGYEKIICDPDKFSNPACNKVMTTLHAAKGNIASTTKECVDYPGPYKCTSTNIYGITSIDTCYCSTDLCNSSGKSVLSYAVVSGFLLAALTDRYWGAACP